MIQPIGLAGVAIGAAMGWVTSHEVKTGKFHMRLGVTERARSPRWFWIMIGVSILFEVFFGMMGVAVFFGWQGLGR